MKRGVLRGYAGIVSIFVMASIGCEPLPIERVASAPMPPLQVRLEVAEDTAPKQDLRMVPPEVFMRTYLRLFGGLSPLEAQKVARGNDGSSLFDTWDDYVSALGFPDYRFDIPRQTQTNALMIATFERLAIALCDRAAEHDLSAAGPPASRVLFAFGLLGGPLDAGGFEPRFDVLHRTFLGYPASLAPAGRVERFYRLYRDTVTHHTKEAPKSRLSPDQAGWAAVCYALAEHPEFHLY